MTFFYGDGPQLDAFGRLRVATPSIVFDAQLTYDLQPTLYQQVTAQSGATITHDTTNRCALMTFASTPNTGQAYIQSYEHFRYQPGRSQAIFLTFNFIEAVTNVLKFVGYSDGTNGVELQMNGTTVQLMLRSATANGNQTVAQASWNLDKMDGSGSSGLTLDLTKIQILTIDFQALYSGRVRVGFDIAGSVVYVHEFSHANVVTTPYIQTANLPIRCGMTCTNTVSTTMRFICCSVVSSGGQADPGGFSFGVEGTVTASSGARTHILSLRPKTTFNSIANRSKFILDRLTMLVTGANSILWELVVGQAISGTTTFNDANTTYSGMEYNTLGTISGSPVIVIASGYVATASKSDTNISINVSSRYPITLDVAGAARALGTISLIVTGVGGASAMRASMNWHETR